MKVRGGRKRCEMVFVLCNDDGCVVIGMVWGGGDLGSEFEGIGYEGGGGK